MNTLLATPGPETQTALPLRFMVVALHIPPARTVPDNLHVEAFGALIFQRALTRALEAGGVKFECPVVTVPALSRVVCGFAVPDLKAALEVLSAEVKSLALAHCCVIGVRDKSEGFFRALWPELQAFDLNRRMATAMPLALDGNFAGEYPELDQLLAALKRKQADDLARLRAQGIQAPPNPS